MEKRDQYGSLWAYGARKIWRQLNSERIQVARCTVAFDEIPGIGGRLARLDCRTTLAYEDADRPEDLINRQFNANRPNQLWVADISFVATWSGFVFVALVIDAFDRTIVGWRVVKSLHPKLVLDALEQAFWSREKTKGLIHHSDRGSKYLSIRFSERLAQAGKKASVGTVDHSNDNALAETKNGLYKTEVIRHKGPWRTLEDFEFEILE